MKKLLKLILVISLIGGGTFWYYNYSIHSPINEKNSENNSFRIEKWATAKEIAKDLEEAGLIRSSTSFYLYIKSENLGSKILAGRFQLNESMNVPEILEALTDLSSSESVITIQEGLKIRNIDEKLVELGLLNPGDFKSGVQNWNGWEYYEFLNQNELSSLELVLEGYIYPDTYFLDSLEFTADDLIYLSLDNFERKLSELDLESSTIYKKYSLHEIITMASIIENEVFGVQDRKVVSGILWKRLENTWTIGADATLLYIKDDNIISSADLETDSPYNTRKNLGLPPGPISNPSIESINAALFPTETDYWFYLTTLETGKVIYSKSNEEHNQNRTKYLQ